MKLRIARAMKEKTQWDVAWMTGISQAKISLIETGLVKASDYERNIIAQALEIDPAKIDWPAVKKRRPCKDLQ